MESPAEQRQMKVWERGEVTDGVRPSKGEAGETRRPKEELACGGRGERRLFWEAARAAQERR